MGYEAAHTPSEALYALEEEVPRTCPAKGAGKVRVVDLRIHFARQLPGSLMTGQAFVEVSCGGLVTRSKPVKVEAGVAPFNAWTRLTCDADAEMVQFKVRRGVRCAVLSSAGACI